MLFFLVGNRTVPWATGAFLGGKSHDHRRFEKEVSFKKNQLQG